MEKWWAQNASHHQGCRQCGKTFSVLDLPIRIMSMLCILTFPAPRIQVGIWWWPGHRSSLHDTFYLNTWCQFRIGQNLYHLWRDTGMPTCSHSLEILQDWWQIRCHRYGFPAGSQRLPYQCFVRGSNSCWLRDYHRHVSNGFEEWLWANGIKKMTIDYLHRCLEEKTPVQEAIHERMRQLLLHYCIVGGMPRAVSVFMETHNMQTCYGCSKPSSKNTK